ncbi:hypothetical protein [Staphylococcus simulans]|uniref:hypothetical protein n=1 Tax=Staphylococcus simulans TaxID=1286 RepID=UPI00115D4E93|nr:hypothetical protein [Staphylococcus simulans]
MKPDWKTVEKQKDRAMIYLLIHEEDEWGRLERHAKYKYKKMIKDISSFDLTDLMKMTLQENKSRLQRQIDFWIGD